MVLSWGMRAPSKAGFTLLEIMIVLVIVGGLAAIAIPAITNRNNEVKAFLRSLTTMSRDLHTRAKLQGTAYRIVIDLGESSDGKSTPQQYWVEKANGKVVLNEREEEKAMELAKDPDKPKDAKGFTPVKDPKPIPSVIRIDRVELTRLTSPITQGKAFIHYLPEGLVDEAVIRIKGNKDQIWTIAVHPLTGKAELIFKSVGLKEIRDQ